MNALAQLVTIAAVSLAAAGGTFLIKGPPQRALRCDPAAIQPDEVCLEQIPDGAAVVWVDARSRADWEKNGLPGSVLWNLDPAEDATAFEAGVAMKIAETPRAIVYCGDENCGVSRQVAARIREIGMEADVSVLHGGWRALNEAGRIRNPSRNP
jgi:rhodanese-related sulfurtransferase